MGLDQSVIVPAGTAPGYPEVAELLNRHGFPVQMRMIDGQLAFPDETPPDSWQELRLATPQGMVTVRKQPGRVTCVTWGNADRTLLQAWNAVTWAIAEAANGQVETASGPQSAADFRAQAELPTPIKPS
jgi:hypothetical protein